MKPAEASGILLLDKPVGPTSHDVVLNVRRRFSRRVARSRDRRFKVGHAGTLDPRASGLLLVLTGRGTRLAPLLVGLDKVYQAEVRFGVATDTLDADGTITATAAVPSAVDLTAALAAFTGTIIQRPPIYSSIKRGGKSLHELARAGKDVDEPDAREVTITSCEARDIAWGVAPDADEANALPPAPDGKLYRLDLTIACSSGTYVRSLARDLGAYLGTVAHLHALRRVQIGPYCLADALALAAFDGADDPAATLLPLARALAHVPAVTLDAATAATVRRSGHLEDTGLALETVASTLRLLDPDGALVAVARRDSPLAASLVAVFPLDQEDRGCA